MIHPDVRLNLVDRLFLLLDGVQGPPSLNLYALSLEGEWDFATLRIAVTDLLAEQPLLRTRARRTRMGLRRDALDVEAVENVFEVGPAGLGAGWESEIERDFMRRPLDLVTQPPVRILARPNRIVMGLHHSVADGIGGYFVLDRLASHYTARLNGQPVEPPPEAPPRRYSSYFRRFTPAERRRAVGGMGNVLREMLLPLGPYATFGDLPLPTRGQFAWRELVLPPLQDRIMLRDGRWRLLADQPAPAADAEATSAPAQAAPKPRRAPWLFGGGALVVLIAALAARRRRRASLKQYGE